MNKEQISEKEIEKVSGGTGELVEAMKDHISKHSKKVKCTQCGKTFEICSEYMLGVVPTPAFYDSRRRCPECREKKPFPEFMLKPHERWRIKNKTEKTEK